jgi:RimJ/RimL family protein N-acetyltransferase
MNDALNLHPLPDVIQTKRLLLRKYALEDLENILAYATDPNWSRFLPVPQPYKRQHALDFINNQLALDRLTHPSFAIEFESKVVGGVNVRFDFNNCHGELGYSIAPSVWGKGLITEASRAIIDLSFSTYPELRRITAIADAENVASLRVMDKLGMIKEGVLRQHRKTHGKFIDVVYCGILREEWQPNKEHS